MMFGVKHKMEFKVSYEYNESNSGILYNDIMQLVYCGIMYQLQIRDDNLPKLQPTEQKLNSNNETIEAYAVQFCLILQKFHLSNHFHRQLNRDDETIFNK